MTKQSPSTGPQPPTGLTVVVRGDGTAVVSWEVQQSRVCDAGIENYSVRYQLRSGMGGIDIITVYSPSTSVTLQGLACGEEYTVSVAAINSKGGMSSFSTSLHVRKFYIPTLTFIILVSCRICTHTYILIDCMCTQRCLFIFSSFCSSTHSKLDAVYEDPQLLDNPAYGTAGTVKAVKGEEDYETCF